jgi:hypothetical protein
VANSQISADDAAAREDLIIYAAGGIETLVNVLLREIDTCEDEQELARFTRIAINKIHDLNSVILSVKDSDVGRKTEEMAKVVHG